MDGKADDSDESFLSADLRRFAQIKNEHFWILICANLRNLRIKASLAYICLAAARYIGIHKRYPQMTWMEKRMTAMRAFYPQICADWRILRTKLFGF